MIDTRIVHVGFWDEKVAKAFFELKDGKFDEKILASWIDAVIDVLKKNPDAGITIPKRLCPIYYTHTFGIRSVRKYDMQNGWRLIYTMRTVKTEIRVLILEWFSHKEYEKRFKY